VSFWRYTLGQELAALAVALGVLGSISWLSLRELNRRYIDVHRTDADRVQLHLQEHLNDAVQQFEFFRSLEPESRQRVTRSFYNSFSDIYQLDSDYRVIQMHKQQPDSRVFKGFSFARSRVADYLQEQTSRSGGTKASIQPSSIIRAAEDEVASVYLGQPDIDGKTLLLARLNLNYLQNFLRRVASISGSPLLLVNQDGFVLLSSTRDLDLTSIDLRNARHDGMPEPIEIGGARWLPVGGSEGQLGSRFVTLLPARPLEELRQVIGLASLVASLLLVAIAILKTRRLHTQVFNPVRTFADQLQRVEGGRLTNPDGADPQRPDQPVAPCGFLEMLLIQDRFTAMLAAIDQRESELRQALRASLAAAAVGHEIKQPLSTIRLLCQQASRCEPSAAGLGSLLAQLDSESGRVARTVESMRMLLGNVQSNQEPLDLASAAANAITVTHHQRRALGVVFTVEGLNGQSLEESSLPVLGDPMQMQIAIGNLLRNGAEAVAAMAPAERLMQLRLLRQPASPDHPWGLAGVEVGDSGPGLPEGKGSAAAADPGGDLGRQPLRSTKSGGSGLGLFVVRTTLEQHGGWLQAGRCPHLGGAAFSLWLPLRPDGEF
jgi:signal transduction histidine kinase